MKGLAAGLLAVAVLLACVASICSGDTPEVEIDMAKKTSTESSEHHPEVGLGTAEKTETGIPIKIVPLGHAPGENATPVKLVSLGEAPAGGTEIKTVFVPLGKPPEQPPDNAPPEVPPEKPPDKPPEVPPVHVKFIPNPARVRLVREEPENWPRVKLMPEGERPDNMLRLMPAPELPDNATQVRLMPASDVPLPENTVSVKPTEN